MANAGIKVNATTHGRSGGWKKTLRLGARFMLVEVFFTAKTPRRQVFAANCQIDGEFLRVIRVVDWKNRRSAVVCATHLVAYSSPSSLFSAFLAPWCG